MTESKHFLDETIMANITTGSERISINPDFDHESPEDKLAAVVVGALTPDKLSRDSSRVYYEASAERLLPSSGEPAES